MTNDNLPDWLQNIRGRVRKNASMAKRCWFGVGGEADYLVTPEDVADLTLIMRQKPDDIPLTILGVGSNILIRDGGIEGLVIRLGRQFTNIELLGKNRIKAGAAAMDINVANTACDAAIAGLEFLAGIPGTIGGALKMNGGAYGDDIANILEYAELVDDKGNIHKMNANELGYSYRHSELPDGWIFTGAVLKGTSGNKSHIAEKIKEITDKRSNTQPIRSKTGGSTFKNPPASVSKGKKAWQLIDEAGCRGLQIGGAKMSEIHCNFMINTGNATANDLETLGEEVRRRVKEHSGVTLEWEIKIIGRKTKEKGQ